eukprot:CAMPEP_0177568510 /NCGR_PEP_ID=MMETSP0369-20130122/75807_1 /TAXON_ID=447022 ORGANISM="Scrippsiella hangoei-like, Strain SHHI-4" /NCGR_SAMPLE_ID=MMETSP0369 /ASSEMBLY_ACC=CAM_ASM_000364 /LENGTH=48 /DNA_ID= /DNA_START= /DNA_END= /DNA_ORIENTATION=
MSRLVDVVNVTLAATQLQVADEIRASSRSLHQLLGKRLVMTSPPLLGG